MKTLEELIEIAAEHLPEGWQIEIRVENGSGTVTAFRPDGSEVHMDDGENDMAQQFRDAILLARDETLAEQVCPACLGVPEHPEVEGSTGCMRCDFNGTLAGFRQMQRMDEDAYRSCPNPK